MCLCQNNTSQKSSAQMIREQTDIYAIQKIDAEILNARASGRYSYLHIGELPKNITSYYERQGFLMTPVNKCVKFEWHHV